MITIRKKTFSLKIVVISFIVLQGAIAININLCPHIYKKYTFLSLTGLLQITKELIKLPENSEHGFLVTIP